MQPVLVLADGILAGVLDRCSLVAFTGGRARRQATQLGEQGRNAVRGSVSRGCGYLGICAGAYLATAGYSWSLGLLNVRTVSPKWRRGKRPLRLHFTRTGARLCGDAVTQQPILYNNGPIVRAADGDGSSRTVVLATYAEEVSEHGTPPGIMVGSPAAFCGRYGQGRVCCFGPHPEQSPGWEDVLGLAAAWTMRRLPQARRRRQGVAPCCEAAQGAVSCA